MAGRAAPPCVLRPGASRARWFRSVLTLQLGLPQQVARPPVTTGSSATGGAARRVLRHHPPPGRPCGVRPGSSCEEGARAGSCFGGGPSAGAPAAGPTSPFPGAEPPRALWAQVLGPLCAQPVAGTGAHPELGASQKSQPVHSRRPVGHAGCPRANGGVRLGIA